MLSKAVKLSLSTIEAVIVCVPILNVLLNWLPLPILSLILETQFILFEISPSWGSLAVALKLIFEI